MGAWGVLLIVLGHVPLGRVVAVVLGAVEEDGGRDFDPGFVVAGLAAHHDAAHAAGRQAEQLRENVGHTIRR
jgi:hypothetical protein